jgi:hypothetical protein
MTKRRAVVVVAVMVAAGAAVMVGVWMRGQPQTELSSFGAQYAPLVESGLRDENGQPVAGENRWDLVEQLLALHHDFRSREHPLPDGEHADFDVIASRRPADPGVMERTLAAIRELEEQGAIALLDELARAKRAMRPPQEHYAIDWLMPEIGMYRVLTRYSDARMRLAGEQGDPAGAARALEHMMAIARIASQDPFIISHMVSAAVSRRAMEALRAHLMERQLGAAEIRLLQEALEGQRAWQPIRLAVQGAELLELDTLRMIYDDTARTPSQWMLTLQGTGGDPPSRLSAWAGVKVKGGMPSREEAIASTRQVHGMILAAAQGPRHEMLAAMQQVEDHLAQLSPRESLSPLLSMPPSRAAMSALLADAVVDGMRLMLSVEAYRAERGEYPEDLAALVPMYIAELPLDPFTGAPYLYRRLAPGEDEHGRGYLLYSAGPDGQDDGGRNSMDPASAGKAKPGDDLVINRWRGVAHGELTREVEQR